MSQNFFSRLAETEQLLAQELPEERSENYDLSIKTICALKRFVYSCAWSNTEKTRLLMRNIHRKAIDAAKITGVSANTVRSARSQASKKLFGMFGDDVFDGMIVGDKQICYFTLNLIKVIHEGYDRPETFLPEPILQKLEGMAGNCTTTYELKELTEELLFFKQYSMISMMKQFSNLDPEKLSFLFRIFQSDLLISTGDTSINIQKLRFLSKIM